MVFFVLKFFEFVMQSFNTSGLAPKIALKSKLGLPRLKDDFETIGCHWFDALEGSKKAKKCGRAFFSY